ncbi:MAG: hypothetical protein IT286_05110 [Proteobacteria bacterium]|nr:hypothetical protein [Pseudomonadota bacterium]
MHSIEAPASARMVIDGVETSRNEIIGKLEIELIQTLVDMGWRELDAASMVRMFRYHDIL